MHKTAISGRIPWVFFDLDDTLWDFRQNSLKSLDFVYRNFGEISSKFPTVDKFIDIYHIHNSELWALHSRGEISSAELKTERWRRTLFAADATDKDLKTCGDIDKAYLFHLSSQAGATPFTEESLATLSRHFIIGVISNGFNDTQYRKLQNSGLWRYVTRVIISEEIGVQKPAKEIFSYAVRETGAWNNPVMVGDNPLTDIIGALKAGWEAIYYKRDDAPSVLTDDFMISEGINPAKLLATTDDMREVTRLLLDKLR